MKRLALLLSVALLWTSTGLFAADAVETREIEYDVAGAKFKGFLALPKGSGKVPGVLVVHEWWGHNEYARKRARQLAELGYAAFALDMYGKDKTATDPKTAGEYSKEATEPGKVQTRFEAALKLLKAEPRVDGEKIAAIGYCFGGNVVLSMAQAGEPLKAAVSFHGSLPDTTGVKKDSVKTQLLVLHGADDQFVSKEAVAAYEKAMKAAKAPIKVVVYPGAKHGFSDEEASHRGEAHKIPIAYNKAADEKSWDEMKKLFKKVL